MTKTLGGPFQPEVLAELRRTNRLDPKLLYASKRQAELWKQVASKHAPVHANPDFRRIYDEAFVHTREALKEASSISLVGLGSGTGEKEAQLCRMLVREGREIFFSAVDYSNLAGEACRLLVRAGARCPEALIRDLADTAAVRAWLDGQHEKSPRVLTLFGLVPQFLPSDLGRLLRGLLRTNDVLLASVHLAPVHDGPGGNTVDAMRVVLPQYDNEETLAWLNAGRERRMLHYFVHEPEIRIGVIEGIPAFLGVAEWKSEAGSKKPDEADQPPLRFFHSLRYTPDLFEDLLRGEGLASQRLSLTSCRQEGIWSIRMG